MCVKALFLCQEYLGGVVVRHRSGVSEEHGRLGIGREGVRFEAKVGDRVYLEDRIAGGTGNRGFRCGAWKRHGDVATKDFAGILKGLTQQVLATPGVRGGGARVVRTQTDAPQRVVGACFGEAAVAGLEKGKVHVFVLGKFCKVAV